MKKIIRLGTRGSPLALVQADNIKRRLFAAHPQLVHETDIEIIPISTNGDWRPEHLERRFVDMGGNKGMFTKEIEDALLCDHIDMAVHSMKDLASVLPDGMRIAAIVARDDPHDVFIGRTARSLDELPPNAIVGTSSLRRQAQILAQRPDLRVVPLRGNVETRLKKLQEGLVDATILAFAGIARLGFEKQISSLLSSTVMLPAAGQGSLGVEIREGDEELQKLLAPLNDHAAHVCITAERAVMRALGGTCHTPAGAYARLTQSGLLALEALVARADGSDLLRLAATGNPLDADAIGEMLGENLRRRSPADIFDA